MDFFRKKKDAPAPPPDRFTAWQAQPQIYEEAPPPKRLTEPLENNQTDELTVMNLDHAMVVGLASAGAQILHALNKRFEADPCINCDRLSYFIIGDPKDYDLVKDGPVYARLLQPQSSGEDYREAYADSFLDANFRTPFSGCLQNRFGDKIDAFTVFIVGSLREAASAVISDLTATVKADHPNCEIYLLLSFDMMDDIDLVRDGEMLAQLRELGRLTFKLVHVTHRLNRIPNASSEVALPSPTNLIDSIFLFDVRDIARRDDNFILDSVQEITEGLFNFLSPAGQQFFNNNINILARASNIQEDLSECVFNSFTSQSLVYPLRAIWELSTQELILHALIDGTRSLFSNIRSDEAVDSFIAKFIGHDKQHRSLFDWMNKEGARSDAMHILPILDGKMAVKAFRFVLLDVINRYLEDEEAAHNLEAVAAGVTRIRGWLENTLRLGMQRSYQGEQLVRWDELRMFFETSRKYCTQIIEQCRCWHNAFYLDEENRDVDSYLIEDNSEQLSVILRKKLSQLRSSYEDKLSSGKVTRFSLTYDEVISKASEVAILCLPGFTKRLVWKAAFTENGIIDLCVAIRKDSGPAGILEFNCEQANELLDTIEDLARKVITSSGLVSQIQLTQDNQDFLSAISLKAGLKFNSNNTSMNTIRAKVTTDFLESVYIFNNGPSIGEKSLVKLADEIFSGTLNSNQMNLISSGCHNRLSILKFHNIIPFSAINLVDNLQRDYKYRYHLLPQEWNARMLENEMHEYRMMKYYQREDELPFTIVPQLRACMWSPVLFDLFFIALAHNIIQYQESAKFGGHEWKVVPLTTPGESYEPLVLTDSTRLLDAFEAFTVLLPIKNKEGMPYHPFNYLKRIAYLKTIYEMAIDLPHEFDQRKTEWLKELRQGGTEQNCLADIMEFKLDKIAQHQLLPLAIREPLFTYQES